MTSLYGAASQLGLSWRVPLRGRVISLFFSFTQFCLVLSGGDTSPRLSITARGLSLPAYTGDNEFVPSVAIPRQRLIGYTLSAFFFFPL